MNQWDSRGFAGYSGIRQLQDHLARYTQFSKFFRNFSYSLATHFFRIFVRMESAHWFVSFTDFRLLCSVLFNSDLNTVILNPYDIRLTNAHPHQSKNMFKSCSVKHGLKIVFLVKASYWLFSVTLQVKITECVWVYLNPVQEPVFQISFTGFRFLKPGFIKHVYLVWMGYKAKK